MSIEGTYVHDKHDNLGPFLKAIGIKDEKIEQMTSAKPKVTLALSEGKLEIVSKGTETVTNSLTLGAPSTYTLFGGFEIEVNIQISGSSATGTLKKGTLNGDISIEFSDSGLVETFDVGGNVCKRYYKRS